MGNMGYTDWVVDVLWLTRGTLCDVANLMSHRSPGVLGTKLFQAAYFRLCFLKDTLKTRNLKQLGPRPRDSPLATGAPCVDFQGKTPGHVLYRTVPYRALPFSTPVVPYSTVPYAIILEPTVLYCTVPSRAVLEYCGAPRDPPRNIPLLPYTLPSNRCS